LKVKDLLLSFHYHFDSMCLSLSYDYNPPTIYQININNNLQITFGYCITISGLINHVISLTYRPQIWYTEILIYHYLSITIGLFTTGNTLERSISTFTKTAFVTNHVWIYITSRLRQQAN